MKDAVAVRVLEREENIDQDFYCFSNCHMAALNSLLC